MPSVEKPPKGDGFTGASFFFASSIFCPPNKSDPGYAADKEGGNREPEVAGLGYSGCLSAGLLSIVAPGRKEAPVGCVLVADPRLVFNSGFVVVLAEPPNMLFPGN